VADVDWTAVVMSIQPKYADALVIARTKLWEFRRQPLPDTVLRAVVYRSGPPSVRGLIGDFHVEEQRRFLVQEIADGLAEKDWRPTDVHPALGISPSGLAAYAGGWDQAVWGILPKQPVRAYPAPIPLARLGWDRGPMSWRYAPLGWEETIRG
jgi:predicted transcriptional regulator